MELHTVAIVVSALITGIISPLLTLFIQKKIKDSELPVSSSKERLQKLQGKWYGFLEQEFNGQLVKFDGETSFTSKGKQIVGEIKMNDERGEKMRLVLDRGIFDGDILKCDYRNECPGVHQKGTCFGRMNAKGDEIHGKFVGYSPSQEKIITGDFSLKDDPSPPAKLPKPNNKTWQYLTKYILKQKTVKPRQTT